MTVDLTPFVAQRSRYEASDNEFASALGHLQRLVHEWHVELEPRLLGEPTCSFAAAGRVGKHEVVLKVPIVGEERTSGYRAALAFMGHGGVDVLEGDDLSGSLLMKHLTGPDLSAESPSNANGIWVDLYAQLQSAPHFAGLDLLDDFGFPSHPVPEFSPDEHLTQTTLFEHLSSSTPRTAYLHGDLHHFNIMEDRGHWYAIDAKGWIADPHWEASAFLRNPFEALSADPDLRGTLTGRIERIAAALALDPDRIRDWAVVQTYSCVGSESSAWSRAMIVITRALQLV